MSSTLTKYGITSLLGGVIVAAFFLLAAPSQLQVNVPWVVANIDCTQATCATSDTTIFTTGSGASGSGQAGLYEVKFAAVTLSGWSGIACSSFTQYLSYTDEDSGNPVVDDPFFNWAINAGSRSSENAIIAGPEQIWVAPSTAIKYEISPNVPACTGGTYSAHLSLVQIR